MPLGRGGHDVVYEKMGKKKFSASKGRALKKKKK